MQESQENLFRTKQKRNWIYILTPCVWGIVFSLFVIVMSKFLLKSSGGWSFLGVIIFVPVALGLFGLDVIFKYIF